MRKICLVMALALVLAGLGCGVAWAKVKTAGSTEYVSVYVNGEKSDLQALVVNGHSYLPLRDLAELLCLDIDWNQAEKRVELCCLNEYQRIWVERKTQASGYLSEEGLEWQEERELSVAPLLRRGRVWLPISFFEGMTEADVSWDSMRQVVYVDHIPFWQGGKWTFGFDEGDWQISALVQDGSGMVKDVSWLTIWQGADGTLGSDFLWRLGPNGQRQRMARDWDIPELKAYGDKCYYLSSYRLMAPVYDIYQVDGESGQVLRMGQEYFVYNTCISNKGYMAAGRSSDLPVSWWVDSDGVWAVGFDRRALGDEAIVNKELAGETYGLYRLYPGGHELVEKYDLPA